MPQVKFNDNFQVGNYLAPYFIAEMNTSHFGKIETAKKMIQAAKKAGCHCVKFQSWTVDSLYSEDYYKENPIAKRFVKGFSFDEKILKELASYCNSIDISFASTPYSFKEVDFLVDECHVPFIKIASMDLNNHRFLKYIGEKRIPIVLSTGMGDIDEIREAIQVLESTQNKNIVILHCISIYPPEISTIHLHNIKGLQEEFPNYPIGFSDHSIGTEIPIASIALGSALIEKHFTLDKSKIGMDNQIATQPDEMKYMVTACNIVQKALGSKKRVVLDAELLKREEMRRSVVLNKDMKKGDIIQLSNIDCKRPGTGIAANNFEKLIGKKLTREIKKNFILHDKDVESEIEIRQANLNDTKSIMQFIDQFWKKDHILALNKEFFLYEFRNHEKLNIIIALEDNMIVGFLGFFYYNSNSKPHMAGSIWKTHPDAKDQLLGVKIRNYFTKNIPHDFFATPGPGLHMKPVYKMLRMNWFTMDQYYMANDTMNEYSLIKNPKFQIIPSDSNSITSFKKASSIEELKTFVFNTNIVPTKDFHYIQKRYFHHPIYDYEIYYLQKEIRIENIIVMRICKYKNNVASRIVDFFGDVLNMRIIGKYLYELMISSNYEYIDFISYGYNKEDMKKSGFSCLDLSSEDTIVPNYFEPFIQKNILVYSVCDKTNQIYRQHKADGDMDRPSR